MFTVHRLSPGQVQFTAREEKAVRFFVTAMSETAAVAVFTVNCEQWTEDRFLT
jgi:hypothetical protein